MKEGQFKRFKKGAASFYVVAFSTLILLIISASFATVIISEITRTSNDDLAQSAYDSALAGVEDAKLAYYNYRNCVEQGQTLAAGRVSEGMSLDCSVIMYYMENSEGRNCDMVGHMLGRIPVGKSGQEVKVTEESGDNNMAQAYTCVEINKGLKDYRATLSSTTPSKLVPVVLDEIDGVEPKEILSVKISWTADTVTDLNYVYYSGGQVIFPKTTLTGLGNPPVIALTLVQTGGDSFQFTDFNKTVGDKTNRGTIYLTPVGLKNSSNAMTNAMKRILTDKNRVESSSGNYLSAYNGTENFITAQGFRKSNDKTSKNYPYAVYCSDAESDEFVCSATVRLPEPIGGDRNADTFMFVVSLPYGGPSTDFAMEFCRDENGCVAKAVAGSDEPTDKRAKIASQIGIDSTGRANYLYRRVETRMESANASMSYPLYAIQLLGDIGNGSLADKDLNWVTSEYGISEGGDSAYDGH